MGERVRFRRWDPNNDAMRAKELVDRGGLAAMDQPLYLWLTRDRKPRTRGERLRMRLKNYGARVVTAWRVLRGDDVHEHCDR